MPVTVRRAVLEDARRIAELAVKLVAQHRNYSPQRFAQVYDEQQAEWFYGRQTKAEDAAVLVAELEEKIVGFAYVQYEARNYAELLENAAWLHDIYIDEAARGQNAGKLLIESAIEIAKELGADKLMLSVAAKNEFAGEFFERSGFKTTMVEMMLDLLPAQLKDADEDLIF
ncbi:MAG TPA: GNAT family N-acetyltransferase [Pyrinomonadaceae bacterium]|nr:GNAT family N-acetyltransferase [Pyrinomonadaceae bacterium]